MAWEDVCVPREEGDLGIMRTKEWNKAVMMMYIWNLQQNNNNSLWSDKID